MAGEDVVEGDDLTMAGVRLLAGGNPQIAKGDGPAPVEAYIVAMPGWKSAVGRRLDELIEEAVPDVARAVRWNQPMYGVEDEGWFASFRCFTRYVKVTWFHGALLDPQPPETLSDPDARALHVHEGDELDEDRLRTWFAQAADGPGWVP